jgi:hypothetical protein
VSRRRSLPPELAKPFNAFARVLRSIGEAKEELTAAMPTTRLPGRPLAEAIAGFESALDRAEADMPAWRAPVLEEAWAAASSGIELARRRVEELRRDAPDPQGFEGLIWVVSRVLDPLDDVEAAADRFRSLRGPVPKGRRRPGDSLRR